jgi:hypothetical protein
MAELRYVDQTGRSHFFAFFLTKEEASTYLSKRAAMPGHDPAKFTISDDRPVRLFRNGALADTFNTKADAEEDRDRRIKAMQGAARPRGRFLSMIGDITKGWSIQ